ncbi:T9SS type A sorting domain-containing protein [Fluviicola sp.]|uniref:T9SS type A sorting domain-containing protein n=1 Tax=Fluviicola sp. TaxID=1917219 RepID=UPI0031DBEA09
MNKSLLKEKLKSYSALATAMFGTAAAADAQIVYTDVNPDVTLNVINDSLNAYEVDFDNDGNAEMIVASYGFVHPQAGQINLSINLIQPNNVAALLGYDDAGYPYVSALASGTLVDPAATNWYDTTAFGGSQAANAVNAVAFGAYGQFNTGADLYMGARFVLATGTHYGWVRIQVPTDVTSTMIKDYAYRTVPNMGLTTGQTGLGIAEMPANVWYTYVNGKNVTITSKEEGNLTIIDMTGKTVATGKMENGTATMNLSDATSGMYIVQFENNGVMGTKKVILN